MKKKTKICGQCFEEFDFVAIVPRWKSNKEDETDTQFCSHKCLEAFRKRKVIKLGPTDWQKLVKAINAK